ncbi:PREDICTED: ankyrin repeat domain-containing protein 40-like [Amphimedon queenslandica]|uniref:Uncharacterized protein n=1 Tax=Amphimedon queenslandica TaxID=400682 RepID=A0A1X7VSN3_AMPQE|nr:PREDICTED: ankyrin repeat domain-containing protein 40-like [Amphimedon queenslandica]|eukprot:XP_003382779.1 PREDICTED: ankyrin repeat domain-containing protein 40-like [Amphimedon queenslandica]
MADKDEALREAVCIGNMESARKLIKMGASVNSQNIVNGWTALHWACKRGHKDLAEYLLSSGADPSIKSCKGETPDTVTTDKEISQLLSTGGEAAMSPGNDEAFPTNPQLPIIPNYLRNPPFPYTDTLTERSLDLTDLHISESKSNNDSKSNQSEINFDDASNGRNHSKSSVNDSEITAKESLRVKVRIANSGETDFIEVDVQTLSYIDLLRNICEELEVSPDDVSKIRKLPNVLIRKDKDISRLENGQELELVLK